MAPPQIWSFHPRLHIQLAFFSNFLHSGTSRLDYYRTHRTRKGGHRRGRGVCGARLRPRARRGRPPEEALHWPEPGRCTCRRMAFNGPYVSFYHNSMDQIWSFNPRSHVQLVFLSKTHFILYGLSNSVYGHLSGRGRGPLARTEPPLHTHHARAPGGRGARAGIFFYIVL
jgi:hypothetical protein